MQQILNIIIFFTYNLYFFQGQFGGLSYVSEDLWNSVSSPVYTANSQNSAPTSTNSQHLDTHNSHLGKLDSQIVI